MKERHIVNTYINYKYIKYMLEVVQSIQSYTGNDSKFYNKCGWKCKCKSYKIRLKLWKKNYGDSSEHL